MIARFLSPSTAEPSLEGYEGMDIPDQLDCTPAGWERSRSLALVLINIMAKAYKDWGGFDANSDRFDNGGNGFDGDDELGEN